MQAQREAQRLAKLKEVEETNTAVQAACEAQCREREQQKAAQQRQMALYRQQQEEADACKRSAAAAAAHEAALDRADSAAAELEAAAAAAAVAAAERAKLEAFKLSTAAAVEAKKAAAAQRREQERLFTEECHRVSADRSLNTCLLLHVLGHRGCLTRGRHSESAAALPITGTVSSQFLTLTRKAEFD